MRKPRTKRKPSEAALKRRMANQIPEEIQNDPELTKAIEQVTYGLYYNIAFETAILSIC